MRNTILTKSLYSLRWQLVGWSAGIIAIAWITLGLYPSFSQDGIQNIVNSIPDSFKSLVGDIADFKTVPGYIGQQIFGPNLYIVSIVMAIIIFLSVSASEESDGRLQTLLSFPVSRTRVYFQKWLAAATTVGIASCTVIVGICMALLLIDEQADMARVWQSVLDFVLINIAFGSIVFAVSYVFGNKMMTILVVSVYTVASFFITSLAPSVDKLEVIDKFSLLHYYNNPQIMTHGIQAHHIWLVIGVTVLLVLIGWVGFLRRDVRTA